ncbi:hypothetical protein [Pseudoalteromonas rhizosphaerae]|uniref:hypothetical protein n=1 Tax=Pseudoalteromonas rhizosphaerae TaxID=2518973 RepID=UPI00384C358D
MRIGDQSHENTHLRDSKDMAMPISVDNAEHYNWGHKGDNCDGWHLVKSSALNVIQERVPTGSSRISMSLQSRSFLYLMGRRLC